MRLSLSQAQQKVHSINKELRQNGCTEADIVCFWEEFFKDLKKIKQGNIRFVVFFDKNVVGISQWMIDNNHKVKYVRNGDKKSWVGTQIDTKVLKKGIKLKVTNGRYNNRTLHPLVVSVIDLGR